MTTLRDTAIIEALSEAHATYVGAEPNPNVSYCQLTTRRGLLKPAEMRYIEDHKCPVCGKPPFGLPSDAELFARSYAAKLEHEAAAQVPPATAVVDPGPTIRLDGDAARFGLNSKIAREIAEEAARVDPNRW